MIDPRLESTEAFKAIVENTLDFITIVDDQGQIAYQNPAIKMLGYDQQELLGERIMDRVHPDDQARIGEALIRILAPTDRVERHELRFLHKEGSWRYIEVVGRHFQQGSFTGALINTRDITAKNEIQQDLEHSTTLFGTIFSVSRNILAITRPDTGIFLDVNKEWLKTFGYEKDEVVGRSSIELNVWGSKAKRDELIDQVNTNGGIQNYEATVLTKSGEQRTLIVDATYIDVLGESRLLFSASDITDQKIVEDQLRQSQKMEAIGQLTGGVAHDFNNLLSVVSGNAELIAEFSRANPQIKELVDAILKATDRGAALTQQLLAFSRRQSLSPRAVYVDKLLLEMQPMLERTLSANITVQINNPNDLWACFADPLQLENAILNIALNARDAMPTGGELTISTANRAIDSASPDQIPGNYVEITLTDSGKGIPVEMIDHVFEPFFTTKETGKGTGLGLSMVFGFVKQSGGNIQIQRSDQGGTAINISLPRSTSKSLVTESNADQLTIGLGERILLLEDNIDLQHVTQRNLEHLGYKVATASNEAELDKLITRDTFDLLVSDVMLPGPHTGLEIAERLKADHPGLKVLLISGYARGITDEANGEESPARLLSKPFNRGQLSAAIRDALRD